jgi:hypothetical protein
VKIHSVVCWVETPCTLVMWAPVLHKNKLPPSSGYKSLQISSSAKWFMLQLMFCPADELPPLPANLRRTFSTLIERYRDFTQLFQVNYGRIVSLD